MATGLIRDNNHIRINCKCLYKYYLKKKETKLIDDNLRIALQKQLKLVTGKACYFSYKIMRLTKRRFCKTRHFSAIRVAFTINDLVSF